MENTTRLQKLFGALKEPGVSNVGGWNDPQLVVVDEFVIEPDNFSLSAIFTPSMAKCLSLLPARSFKTAEQAMVVADNHMWMRPFSDYSATNFFAVSFQNGHLRIEVPGTRVWLETEKESPAIHDGLKLVPHDIRTSLQMLTLLVGLAKLCQEVRALISLNNNTNVLWADEDDRGT